jgi:hypothetical protein
MTIAAALLILIAAFLSISIGAATSDLHASDAAGNAMSQGFAALGIIAVGIICAILLVMCGVSGGYPRHSGVYMLFAVLFAAVAEYVAFQILSSEGVEGTGAILLPAVCAALPLLVVIRAAWGIYPSLQTVLPGQIGSLGPMALLTLVAMIPFPFLPAYNTRQEKRNKVIADFNAKAAQEWSEEQNRRNKEKMEKLEAVPADGDLFPILIFSADENPAIRDAARARMKTFAKRQADAEEMLGMKHELTLREIPNLDLAATPALCDLSKRMLVEKGGMKPIDDQPIRIEDAEREVVPNLGTMRWLLAHSCDCSAEIAAIEKAVQGFPKSNRRAKLLDDIAAAKSGH